MLNTIWALILPGCLSVYNMIVARTFFKSNISEELYEAAEIDGCTQARFFFQIALPLSKAIIAILVLYYGVGHWNSYFSALVYISDKAKYPLQLVLRNILITNQTALSQTATTAAARAALQEKQQLIKEGKIKKEKPLTEIAEDEIPFDIPESWKWVKVGSLAVVQSSKRVFEKDYVSDGIPFFRSKEIGDLYRNEPIKTELFIAEEHYNSLAEEYGVPQIGDILITSVGTIGNTWICDGRKFYYKDGNITQICGNQFFDSKYVECFLHSPLFEKQALSTVAGTAYSALTIIKLKNLIMPLPPLAEQKRIVAKLEEILPLCERLK